MIARRAGHPRRDRHPRALPRADVRGVALATTTPPSDGAEWLGLAAGRSVRRHRHLRGVVLLPPRARAAAGQSASASRRSHKLFVNKWYFDEIFDAGVVRPMAAAGRFGRTVVESTFVQGVIVGGTVGLVRAGTSFARSIQTGELRSYAALLLVGVSGLVLYFLIVATLMPFTIHLSIVVFLPLAAGPDGGLPAGAHRALAGGGGERRGARLRDRADRGLRPRRRRAAVRDRRQLDLRAGDPLPARRGRAEPVPDRAHRAAVGALHAVGGGADDGALEALHVPHGAGRDRRAGRLLRPGPGAVRRLLRPDARAVLLPDRRLGRGRPRAGHHPVRDLHAGGLAADAGGRDRPGRDRRADGGDLSFSFADARGAHRGRGHAEVDLPAVRRGLPGEGAAVPVSRLGGGHLPRHAHAGARGALCRALEGRRVRLPADRAADPARRQPSTSRS